MSDNSNKRQRKTKLIARECVLEVIDDDEEISCASTSETREDEPATIELLPKLESGGTNHSDIPQHQFAIDIEVEQFEENSDGASDEGCLNIDEEHVTDDDDTIIDNQSKISDDSYSDTCLNVDENINMNDSSTNMIHSGNDEGLDKECSDVDINNDENTDIADDGDPDQIGLNVNENNSGSSSMVNWTYGQDFCERITISEDRIKKEIEIQSQKTTSEIDKQIEILQKNDWCLPTLHHIENYELEIQKAFQTWRVWAAQSQARENILMYKCYVCNMGWWHLYPFREHIKHHKNISVSTESSCNELNVIANYGTYIYKTVKIEGTCWQCQKSIDHFSIGPIKSGTLHSYRCSECLEKFRTCNKLKMHEGKCLRFLKEYYKNKICEPTIQCEYCSVICLSKDMFDHHMALRHTVRSDLYVPLDKPKIHAPCGQTYIYKNFHMCEHTSASTCQLCKVNFASGKQLTLHYNLNNSVTCKYCKAFLQKECMLLDHLLTHSESYVWLYVCKKCPHIFFASEPAYKTHRAHTGTTLHSCKKTRIIAPTYCITPEFSRKLKAEAPEKEAEVTELLQPQRQEVVNEINVKADDNVEDAVISDSDKEFEEMEQSIASTLNNFKDKLVTDENNDKNHENVIENEPKTNEISVQVKTEVMSDEEDVIQIDNLNDDEFEKETELLEAELSKVFRASKTITGEIVNSNLFHEELNIKEEIKEEEEEDEDYEDDIIVLNTDQQFLYSVKSEPDDVPSETVISSTNVISSSSKDISTSSKDISKSLNISVSNFTGVKKDRKRPLDSSNKTAIINNKSKGKTKNKLVEIKSKHSVILNFESETMVKTENDTESQEDDDDILSVEEKSEQDYSEEEWDCVKPKKIKRKKTSNRIYRCVCDFSGIHKEYKEHLKNDCKHKKKKYKTRYPTLKEQSNTWKLYKCSRCLTECNSLNLYLQHLGVHGLPKNTCPKCGLQLASESLTINHVTHHIKSNYIRISVIKSREVVTSRNDFMYECLVCQATVEFKKFFAHWEMHLEFNKVVKIETVKSEIQKYIGTDESSSSQLNAENESSLENKLLQKAIISLQIKPEKGVPRVCVVCQKLFDRSHDMKIHLVQHLLMDALASRNAMNGLKCQICNKILEKPATFKEHLRHHGSLPVYRCIACAKSFSDSSNFAKHKKIHNLRVLICDICQKKFRSKNMLTRHIENHMLTGIIECDVCKKTFHSESVYRKHHKQRHENIKTKFKCMICKIPFDCLKLKWDHMWQVHKMRKFKADCPLCGWKSRKFSDIKTHIKFFHNKHITKKIKAHILNSSEDLGSSCSLSL